MSVPPSTRAVEGSPYDEDGPDSSAAAVEGTADGSVKLVPQAEQLKNPDARIRFIARSGEQLLSEHADSFKGMSTGDINRFIQCFWEDGHLQGGWVVYQGGAAETLAYSGREQKLFWQSGSGQMVQMPSCFVKGTAAWGSWGVNVNQTTLQATLYCGDLFDENAACIIPDRPSDLAALWCAVTDATYGKHIALVDRSLKKTNKTLVKVPFDLAHWQRVAAEKYPNGLPEPQSDDPTQWLFHGHPANAEPAAILQVAVARLAGYRWPAELDETMRLAPEARAWVDKCKDLAPFADDDGVVPLVPMRGEPAAEGRVRDLLRATFGGEWSGAKEATLLAAANADNLDDWLKSRFFAEHCSLFHNRPFLWHIWDGRKKDGFGVLVHYHRLAAPNGEGRRLLEKITHGYLGDWIARQRDEMKANKPGADARLAAALDLQKELEAILAGEPPYDIFIRWKPLHEQPIGWEPDINDGVRMNIRPFIEAGVLRDKVNVKWTKDRGQEPQALRPKADFPWFWSGSTFSGDRVNDVHLSVAVKQKAREAKGKA